MAGEFMNRLMECDHSMVIEKMTENAYVHLDSMERIGDLLDSEIEKMMFVAILSTGRACYSDRIRVEYGLAFSNSMRLRGELLERYHNFEGMLLCPQMRVDDFRVDFGIIFPDADDRMTGFAVECDGHEFHEKTKQQAARDKARDRELVRSGLKVMRYTGSEIWRDPFGCAVDILNDVESDLVDADFQRFQRNAA